MVKKQMKKLLLLFVSIFSISLAVNAQDASGSCSLPGSYDYVNVDYFRDGHLAVSNQSGMMITQLHIKVTCNKHLACEEKDIYKNTTITLVDKNFYDIPPYQTTLIKNDDIKPSEDYERKYNGKGPLIRVSYSKYSVEVDNPNCK